MRIFLDTNIFLRYLLADDERQFSQTLELFQHIEAGKIIPFSSGLVMLEIMHTLRSFYQTSPKDIQFSLEKILKTKNLTLVQKMPFTSAWELHLKTGEKITDCLILQQLPHNTLLCTLDEKLLRLAGENGISLAQIEKRVQAE